MGHAWASFAKNPETGPGWDQLPNVAKLGSEMVVEQDVRDGALDRRCPLFDPIYNAIQ